MRNRINKNDLLKISKCVVKIIYKESERTYYYIDENDDVIATFDCELDVCTSLFTYSKGRLFEFETDDLKMASGKIDMTNTIVVK